MTTGAEVRGFDLDGTLQGAGGVGGLLAMIVSDCPATNSQLTTYNSQLYFPTYDANGNVTAYVSETGAVVAQYAYDGFGRTLSASGPDFSITSKRFLQRTIRTHGKDSPLKKILNLIK